MPRLVPDGPDIPGELIQDQETGELALFCGAGISVPTGLPSFSGLVGQLYNSLNTSPTECEKDYIRQEDFAKALEVLEKRTAGKKFRSELVKLFSSTPKPGSLDLHRALLRIVSKPSGMHLVTTNFDDNFARARVRKGLSFDQYPSLPRLDNWNSVVHLHGRVPAPEPAQNE